MKEVWKEIEGFENYLVSDQGNVMNKDSGRILKYRRHSGGYGRVTFMLNGKYVDKYVHRLVAEAFIPKDESRKQVNHIDGDKYNNKVENLEWCNSKENIRHAMRTGLLDNSGENNKLSKLKEKDVREIKKGIAMGKTITQVARDYGVSISLISMVNSGKRWASINS